MPTCYLCGKPIGFDARPIRRRVKVGEHIKKRYAGIRAVYVETHFGMRVVCAGCAAYQDLMEKRAQYKEVYLMLGGFSLVALGSLFVWIFW
jgi:hypothetical protein